MKMTTTMQMVGTTVVVVTPQKTKYPPKDQKYYKKKDEKKRRDKIIRKNRKDKMEDNNIYSQREYGRHNGCQPFEIYDRFDVVDRDNLEVDQQFMTRKEYDYSIHIELDEFYDNFCEPTRNKRTYSESSDEETQPSKKQKMTNITEILKKCYWTDTNERTKKEEMDERTKFCQSKGISLRDSAINDYNQAMKDIATSRHNLEMAMVDYFWMPESSRDYLNDPDRLIVKMNGR